MINHLVIVGRLTADAELKYTANGKAVAKFSVCLNDSYKKDNQWVDRPYFFNCVCWGNYGETISQHLTKGRMIGVEGKLTHNPWKDGNGSTHNDCSVVVSGIHLFPKPGNNGGGQGERQGPSQGGGGGSEPAEDNIPF
jgi:single-strand DNA-binding protein